MHEPVLLNETIQALHIKSGKKYIDATLGYGGHTKQMLARGALVLGIDADRKMIELAEENIGVELASSLTTVQGNFRDIARLAKSNGFDMVSGVLFDLGVSSVHFDNDSRGFSFKNKQDALDMRLDQTAQAVTAADLLNSLPKPQLISMFRSSMNHTDAVRLANKVDEERQIKQFSIVEDLVKITGLQKKGKIDPSTRPFQALRIAVNTELDNLSTALVDAFELLGNKGRLVVISFHSGEDSIVKKLFVNMQKQLKGVILTKNPTVSGEDEIHKNPRARSAKMRIIEKVI